MKEAIIKIIISLAVLLTAWPAGIFLAKLCADELIKDRKYFFVFSLLLIAAAIFCFFFYFKAAVILSLAYMILVIAVMINKSRNKKFVKKYR